MKDFNDEVTGDSSLVIEQFDKFLKRLENNTSLSYYQILDVLENHIIDIGK